MIKFHTFHLVNTKTGSVLPLQQIGATKEDAERTIREYNFAGIDWTDRRLDYIPALKKYTVVLDYVPDKTDFYQEDLEPYTKSVWFHVEAENENQALEKAKVQFSESVWSSYVTED